MVVTFWAACLSLLRLAYDAVYLFLGVSFTLRHGVPMSLLDGRRIPVWR